MKNIITIVALMGAFLLSAPAMAGSLDSGEHYYKAAERYVSQNRLVDAIKQYEKAIAKDAKVFDFWWGKAKAELVSGLHKGLAVSIEKMDDLRDSKAQKFEWMLLDAQYKLAVKPEGWLNDAKNIFFKARDIAKRLDIDRSDLYLMIARVYRDGGKNKKARKHYSEVIALGGSDAAIANDELASIFRQAQAGGTGKGWVGDLAGKSTINRAMLAAVLVDDVEVQNMFPKRSSAVAVPDDAKDNAFAASIDTVLNIQMSSLGLDAKGRFNPEAAVTRYELAKLVEEILVVYANNEGLSRAFIGTKSPFPDVSPNFHAYNAVFLAVSRGLMAPDDLIKGTFAGKKPVSGQDLLLVLRKLGTLNRDS